MFLVFLKQKSRDLTLSECDAVNICVQHLLGARESSVHITETHRAPFPSEFLGLLFAFTYGLQSLVGKTLQDMVNECIPVTLV